MSEPIDFARRVRESEPTTQELESAGGVATAMVSSNAVYTRVGDPVLRAARDGVRRGLTPQEILQEIRTTHDVHLNVGELRLLLATRRAREKTSRF